MVGWDLFFNSSFRSGSTVIKSVLMASSRETIGWDNGQNAMNVTTQALDPVTGAGSMDLVAAADVYYFDTTP